MAKNNITQYDATAANNTDIDSINIDEGMAASDVNNAIRSLMSHLKNVDTGSQALTALSVTGALSCGALTSNGIDDNANATAMTINSSETVMIGRTSTGYSNTGAQFTASGAQNIFVADGDYALGLGRNTSDGTIQEFRKDGTAVGSIVYSSATNIAIGNTSKGLGVGSGSIFPTNGSTAINDTGLDLGYSSSRFKDLYLSGGVRVGGTGTTNLLDDYEEGSHNVAMADGTSHSLTQNGSYTKIGRFVHFQAKVVFPNTGTDTTSTRLSLPFTVSSRTNYFASTVVGSNGSANAQICIGIGGTATLLLQNINGSTSATNQHLSSANLNISLNYETA